jgi:hypothetical protein
MHPILRLIASRPELVVEHAQAYSDLMATQAGEAYSAWRRRAWLGAAGLVLLGMALALAGVAVMLLTMLPTWPGQAPWVLGVVPALPLAAGIACLLSARRRSPGGTFAVLREQVQADLAMLQRSGAL